MARLVERERPAEGGRLPLIFCRHCFGIVAGDTQGEPVIESGPRGERTGAQNGPRGPCGRCGRLAGAAAVLIGCPAPTFDWCRRRGRAVDNGGHRWPVVSRHTAMAVRVGRAGPLTSDGARRPHTDP